ncbi:PEP-utilizing enzyme (plasmid) [Streptosporangium sp. CA-135522]|uniref:PEP-utilizing enzyme n=1 Tax=Streptosporangium sp. CA-135522 TaxID=3240072 RepID=UPI003D8EC267
MSSTMIALGTKAQTLQRLFGALATARVAEQVTITVAQWRSDPQGCVRTIHRVFPRGHVIVRSSAPDEDGATSSAAGLYTSVLHVPATAADALTQAIDAVAASYTRRHGQHVGAFEILLQPMLEAVTCSGVAFTRDLSTMAPYLVINYDEGERTDTVTSGIGIIPRVARIHHQVPTADLKAPLDAVAATVRELIHLTGQSELDVEFAVAAGQLYVLQVRPLPGAGSDHTAADARVAAEIAQVKDILHARNHPRHGLYGTQDVYSNMADWNPAEMIGAHPRPLALSLYQRLITDQVWRDARRRLGYHDPAPHHLMVTLAGHPYVDLRADFNSYLPADLDDPLCHKLIDCYLTRLTRHPQTHDKVEFRICPSALDFTFPQHAEALAADGFTPDEIGRLRASLLRLTTRVVGDHSGQLAQMHQRISQLPARRAQLLARAGEEHPLFLAGALLDDALSHGTLPFAVAVRGTFIATALWRSLLATGVINHTQHDAFLASIETVATGFATELALCQRGHMAAEDFLARYGHLRPGTYDITVPSYAEAPHLYLTGPHLAPARRPPAATQVLPDRVIRAIDKRLTHAGFDFTAHRLLNFIHETQTRREAYKFQFSANISHALALITAFGQRHGLDAECLSYLTVQDLLACAATTITAHDITRLRNLAEDRRHTHAAQSRVHLPDVITSRPDIEIITSQHAPNFVTTKKVTAPTVFITPTHLAESPDLGGRIVLVENADPGFEYLFSRGIAGLITRYGGAASHMAIRCTEIGIPAAIGCGQDTFTHLSRAHTVTLDCAQQLIIPLI